MRHKTAELETTCRRLTRQTVSSLTMPDGEESGKGGLAPAPPSSRDCMSDPHPPQHRTQAPPAGMLRFFTGGTNEEQCTWSLKASPHKLPITKGRITCKRKNLVGTTSTKKNRVRVTGNGDGVCLWCWRPGRGAPARCSVPAQTTLPPDHRDTWDKPRSRGRL